jgi:hypothetical protein
VLKALISVSRLSEADPLAIHLKSPDAIDAELARSRPVREFVHATARALDAHHDSLGHLDN